MGFMKADTKVARCSIIIKLSWFGGIGGNSTSFQKTVENIFV